MKSLPEANIIDLGLTFISFTASHLAVLPRVPQALAVGQGRRDEGHLRSDVAEGTRGRPQRDRGVQVREGGRQGNQESQPPRDGSDVQPPQASHHCHDDDVGSTVVWHQRSELCLLEIHKELIQKSLLPDV